MSIARAKMSLQVLTPSLVGRAVDCIGVSFASSNDPFTKSLGLTQTQWGILSHMFVQRAAHKGLSFTAVNQETGMVEAIIVNEDWKEKQPEYYNKLEDWAPVRAIFHELHTRFKASHPRIEQGRVLHSLYFTCVRPQYRNQGIVTSLWEQSVELARARNFELMVAEGSAPATENVLWKKLGFKEASKVSFSEFMFEGKKVFEDLPKQGFPKLAIYERSITSNLFI